MNAPRRSRRARTRWTLALTLAAPGLVLAACGGDGELAGEAATTSTLPGGEALARADVGIIAHDIDFPQHRYAASEGDVTVAYRNDGRIPHTLVLEGVDAFSKLVVEEHGDVARGTVALEPGEYVLYCDIAGHRRAGMEATLTVT